MKKIMMLLAFLFGVNYCHASASGSFIFKIHVSPGFDLSVDTVNFNFANDFLPGDIQYSSFSVTVGTVKGNHPWVLYIAGTPLINTVTGEQFPESSYMYHSDAPNTNWEFMPATGAPLYFSTPEQQDGNPVTINIGLQAIAPATSNPGDYQSTVVISLTEVKK